MKTLAVASLPVALLLQHHHLSLKSGQDRKWWWLWASVVVATEMNMLPPEEIPFLWNRLKNCFFSNQVSLVCRSAVQGYRGSHCFFLLCLLFACVYMFFSMMKHESLSVFVVMVLYDKYTAHIFLTGGGEKSTEAQQNPEIAWLPHRSVEGPWATMTWYS